MYSTGTPRVAFTETTVKTFMFTPRQPRETVELSAHSGKSALKSQDLIDSGELDITAIETSSFLEALKASGEERKGLLFSRGVESA